MKRDYHMSDCATNNAPALPVGECNCGLEKHLTEEPFKKFTLMNESLNTFATDNSNGKHLTERTMTAEEYIKSNIKPAQDLWYNQPVIKEEHALEAIRLSKIEALEELATKIESQPDFDNLDKYNGYDKAIQILTSQINQLKNGK